MKKNRIAGVLFIIGGLSFMAASIFASFDLQPINITFLVLGIAMMVIGAAFISRKDA